MLHNKDNKGFTIVELAIALAVLSFAVIGVYNAFSDIIISTHGISNRFTAAYLAQEGIEITRNIRDNNWLQNKEDWLDGLRICELGCQADYTTGSQSISGTVLAPYSDTYLKIDNTLGLYGYGSISGIPSLYKRKITIIPISVLKPNSQSESYELAKVTVSVTWNEKGQERSLEAEDNFYNWY